MTAKEKMLAFESVIEDLARSSKAFMDELEKIGISHDEAIVYTGKFVNYALMSVLSATSSTENAEN